MLEQWATELASEIAPDEAPLAPLVVRAYAAGGAQRAELFKGSRNVHGAFAAADLVAYMPLAFAGITATAKLIGVVLQSPMVGDMADMTKNALSLAEVGMKIREKHAKSPRTEAAAVSYQTLDTLLNQLPAELASAGVPKEKCDAIAVSTLRKLLADPQQGAQVVAELSKA
jgi:hypothetical protein